MKNIVLIGMPGSGKTTFGRAVAEKLGKAFFDADTYLEEKEGKRIAAFFQEGESCFRDAEEEAIRELSRMEDCVIATGGGVVERPDNIRRLRKRGILLFLDRPPADIAADIEVSTRPLLKDGAEKVYALYRDRLVSYQAAADVTVKNDKGEEEILCEILRELERLL